MVLMEKTLTNCSTHQTISRKGPAILRSRIQESGSGAKKTGAQLQLLPAGFGHQIVSDWR